MEKVVQDSYLLEVTNAGFAREEMKTRDEPLFEGQLSIDGSAEGWCDRLTIGQPPREEEDELPFKFSTESLVH